MCLSGFIQIFVFEFRAAYRIQQDSWMLGWLNSQWDFARRNVTQLPASNINRPPSGQKGLPILAHGGGT